MSDENKDGAPKPADEDVEFARKNSKGFFKAILVALGLSDDDCEGGSHI